jgi:hypothetical protein
MGRVNRSGQALAEYVMLLAIVVLIYSAVIKKLGSGQAFVALKKPFEEQYRYTYRFGHPDARGADEGDPKLIPQYSDGFRIFINPSK